MTSPPSPPGPGERSAGVDEVVVRERKGLPVVWIIPLVAIAIGGWLWIQALREQGPRVTITFATAEGLVAGKTKIKFKDIEVGKVTEIEFTEDLQGVAVHVEMDPESEPYLRSSTRFWVVRPRIGTAGVSGLGTLLSGAYIGMEPGTTGEERAEFTGLELPPLHAAEDGGLKIQLTSPTRGSHGAGTPVYYRQTQVGAVERVRFTPDGEGVQIDLYLEPSYKHFLTANSRFYDASGLRASLGADGIQVQVESLDALLTGGIAFGVPKGLDPGPPAEPGAVYPLYPDREKSEQVYDSNLRWVLFFDESLRGLAPGAPVEFRGLKIGEVTEIRATVDLVAENSWIPVVADIHPSSLQLAGFEGDELSGEEKYKKLLELGLRAQLQTGSLLTGSKYIDVAFLPQTLLHLTGLEPDLLEIPTIPSSGAELTEAMGRLPDIVANLDSVSKDLADLLGSEETKATLESLQRTVGGVEALVTNVNGEVDPLVSGLKRTLDDADALLASANVLLEGIDASQPELEFRIKDALSELAAGLRSFRTLTDYLERHPEALLKGKGGE